ncbi:MAG: exosortase F system-associated protein [Cloacibacterium sp.]|jgi:exosortase F-associated protein|nr:exosortase F system-associated protein [Cloacibacterium sp.]
MRFLKWILVGVAIGGLIGVRVSESFLFYDPFLGYFKEIHYAQFPTFEWGKLILHYILRFSLNLFFSVMAVHFLFLNKKWTLQAIVLMVACFLFFFPMYLYCIYDRFEIGHLLSFYARRFVIQPLMVLLIVPLFYYRKALDKN